MPIHNRAKDMWVSDLVRKLEKLEEENKKLNIKVASLEWEIKWLNYTIEKLHKEIEELEKQYQHSIWEDDELIYEEWLYD